MLAHYIDPLPRQLAPLAEAKVADEDLRPLGRPPPPDPRLP